MPACGLRGVAGGVSALGETADETPCVVIGCYAAQAQGRCAGYCRQKLLSGKADNAKECHPDATSCHETGKRPSARLSDEELDAAFEHLEIPDVPLEYEEDDKTGADEEMPLAAHPAGYASGVSFEQIDRAVKTASAASATDTERRKAGRVFGQIEGTELYDRLVGGSATIGEKISGLMDYYLSQPVSTEGDAGTVAVQPQDKTDAPDDTDGFDIRDFV